MDGGAEFDKGRSGKKLLKVKITAEMDGVLRDYTTTFGRCGKTTQQWEAPTPALAPPAAGRQTPRGSRRL